MKRIPLATLLAVCGIQAAEAQEKADVAPVTSPLDVVTVGARGPRIDLEVPSSISKLDENEIRLRRPPRNLTDLLHRVPGVHGQQTGPAQGSPFIRALTGYHVLTTIDGVRLNGSFFRAGPNQYNGLIDPLIIRDVQVVRGPGAVLYGSDALGGLIALRTREPTAPQGTQEGAFWWRAGAYMRYTQPLRVGAEPATAPRIELAAGQGPFGVLVGFDSQDVGDREGGRHLRTLRNTQYNIYNGDAKVRYQVTKQDTLTLAFQRTELRNGPRTHSTNFADSWRGTSVGSDLRRDLDQSRQLIYAQLESKERGPFDRIRANLSLQRHYENQHRVRSSGSETRVGFEIWALGAFVEAETDLDLPLDPTVSYGVDYYHDFVDTFQTSGGVRAPRGAIADDAHYDLFGTYLRLELRPTEWLVLNGAVRYSLARVVARDVDPDPTDSFVFGRLVRTYDQVVGSGGFVLRVARQLSLVGSARQGFRAPNLDDTTSFRAVSSSSFDSPSPGIDPERTVTLETGVKWKTDWFRGQLFYAYTFLRDFIQRVPTGNSVAGQNEFIKENFSNGHIQAVDGEAELKISPFLELFSDDIPKLGLSFVGRFSLARGEADARIGGIKQTDHLRRVPPARFAGVLRWVEPESEWLWAEVEFEQYRKQRRLSQGDLGDSQRIPPRGTPSYTLWHVRVGVSLLEERLKGSIALENIFDRDHRPHGAGTNGYGRRLVLAMELSW